MKEPLIAALCNIVWSRASLAAGLCILFAVCLAVWLWTTKGALYTGSQLGSKACIKARTHEYLVLLFACLLWGSLRSVTPCVIPLGQHSCADLWMFNPRCRPSVLRHPPPQQVCFEAQLMADNTADCKLAIR